MTIEQIAQKAKAGEPLSRPRELPLGSEREPGSTMARTKNYDH